MIVATNHTEIKSYEEGTVKDIMLYDEDNQISPCDIEYFTCIVETKLNLLGLSQSKEGWVIG